MVRVLLNNGHPVTIWNRTSSRADAVVALGAIRAESPAEAVAASELVILSLTDYQACTTSSTGRGGTQPPDHRQPELRHAGADPGGSGLVHPERGTFPRRRRNDHGEPDRHGQAYVFYSGPEDAFEAHQPTLALFGRTDYLGADVGLAQLFYRGSWTSCSPRSRAICMPPALLGAAG